MGAEGGSLPKNRVILALTSPIPTHRWEFGERALKILYNADPRLAPERVGHDETDLRKKLPCANVEDLKPLWAPEDPEARNRPLDYVSSLYWRRLKSVKADGMFSHSRQDMRGRTLPSNIVLESDFSPDISFEQMFKEWCLLYAPTQGYLHLTNKAETEAAKFISGAEEGEQMLMRDWQTFCSGSFGALAGQRTFNLGYLNYFGAEFLTDGIKAELSQNGFDLERLDEGVLLRIGESLKDVGENFERVSSRRSLAKEIIGIESFLIKSEPKIPA